MSHAPAVDVPSGSRSDARWRRGLRRLRQESAAWYPRAEPATLHGAARAALIVGLLVVGTAVSLLRTPQSDWDTLWAEDGPVFLDGALSGNPVVLFEPYAGYMHLVPRLAIWVCTLFPLDVLPIVVTVVAAALVSAVALACFVFLETRIRSIPLRLLAWVSVIGSPLGSGEVANNLANLHWFFMVGAVCALVATPRGTALAIAQCVVVVAAVCSDPLMLMFAPLVIVHWFALAAGRGRAVGISFVAAGAVQLAVTAAGYLFGTGRAFGGLTPTTAELLDSYTYRVVISGLAGPTGAVEVSRWIGVTMPGLLVALILVAILFAVRRNAGSAYTALALLGSSVLFFFLVFRLQWTGIGPAGTLAFTIGQRYAVLPLILFVLALVVSADAVVRRAPRAGAVAVMIVIAAIVVIPGVRDLRWDTPRTSTVSWSEALLQGDRECEDGAEEAQLPIAPAGFGGVEVSCDLVRQAVD